MLTLSTELEDNIILVYLYGNNQRYLFFFLSVYLPRSSLIITKSRSARRVLQFVLLRMISFLVRYYSATNQSECDS